MTSKDFFKAIINCVGDPIFVKDEQYQYVLANDTYCERVGKTRQSVLGKTDYELFPKERADVFRSRDEHIFKTGQGNAEEEQIRDVVDGSPRVVITKKTLYVDNSGKKYIIGAIRDVTKPKRTKAALLESETKYRTMIENSVAGVYIYQDNGLCFVNKRCCEIIGYPEEELLGLNPIMFTHPEDRKIAQEAVERSLAGEADSMKLKVRAVKKDGSDIVVTVLGNTMLYRGRPAIMGTVYDITEQERTQEQLRRSEDKFKKAFYTSPDAININRAGDGMYVSVNAGFTELTGYSEEDVTGKTSVEINIWHDQNDRARLIEGLRAQGKVENLDARFRLKSGEVKYGIMSATLIDLDGVPHILSITRDITQRKQAEEQIRRSEERLRLLIDSVPFGAHIYELDKDDRLVFKGYNRSADRILGMDNAQFLGKTIEEAFPPLTETEIPAAYKRAASTGEGFESNYVSYAEGRISGAYQVHAFQTAPRRMAAFFMDITERTRAEQERERLQTQLVQAQRMESVGRLAGGVAHDFNNVLTVILGYAQMGMMRCTPSEPIYGMLKIIEDSAHRSAEIVKQLLAFARKQTIAPKILDLNDTVVGMLKMLQRLIGEEIDFAWMPGSGLWSIKIDPSQVDQLLANLCVNARDAIDGVGKITIETENVVFDAAYCDVNAGFIPGEYVMLAVSDDGCGMDRDTVSHIFEPFFTTKERGKGTGMGLATVYGIVKQNGGFINVYSEPGKGSTFKIYLPKFAEEAVKPAAETLAEMPRGSGEIVLLVEDDPTIMTVGKAMLESLGYTVLTAGTPGEALQLAKTHGSKINLMITDVVMPEMNGRDLARLLGKIIPGLICLFTSGYTANVIAHHGVLDEGINFLAKPFSVKSLAIKVREALRQA